MVNALSDKDGKNLDRSRSSQISAVMRSNVRKYVRRYVPEGCIRGYRSIERLWQSPAKLRKWQAERNRGREIIHLLHIQKTGGTAVKEALEEALVGTRYTLVLRGHGFGLSDVPVGDKVVFFLRDPVTRFVSGFYSRKYQGRPRYDAPWTGAEVKAFSNFDTPNALAMALYSNDKKMKKRAQVAMRRVRHVNTFFRDWLGEMEYFETRRNDILFIGFQERLDEDFEVLRQILGLDEHVVLPKDDVKAYRRPKTAEDEFTEAAIENLRKWYCSDYRYIEHCRQFARSINNGGRVRSPASS